MDNPREYQITSDFASSGNDNSVTLTLNVPSHSITVGNDSVYTVTTPAPSEYLGKQIRAQITMSGSGSKNSPNTYVSAVVPITWSGGPGDIYAFFDVTRISGGDIQLRCRIGNLGAPPSTITVAAFSVTARVRTVAAD